MYQAVNMTGCVVKKQLFWPCVYLTSRHSTNSRFKHFQILSDFQTRGCHLLLRVKSILTFHIITWYFSYSTNTDTHRHRHTHAHTQTAEHLRGIIKHAVNQNLTLSALQLYSSEDPVPTTEDPSSLLHLLPQADISDKL